MKPEAQPQLRQAVSELQLLYSKHAGEGDAEGAAPELARPRPRRREQKPPGGEGESELWTPGS